MFRARRLSPGHCSRHTDAHSRNCNEPQCLLLHLCQRSHGAGTVHGIPQCRARRTYAPGRQGDRPQGRKHDGRQDYDLTDRFSTPISFPAVVGQPGSGPSTRIDHSGDGLRHRRLHSHSASACGVVASSRLTGGYRRRRGRKIACWRVYSASAIHCGTLFGAWLAKILGRAPVEPVDLRHRFRPHTCDDNARTYLSSFVASTSRGGSMRISAR